MKIRITNPTGESAATRITDEEGRQLKWVTAITLDPISRESILITAHLTFGMVELDMLADWPDLERERVLNRIAEQRKWLDRIEADVRGPGAA